MSTAESEVVHPSAPVDDRARRLGAQRDFLLRSLTDLDRQRAAGDLSEARYRQLHDQYTVEAALVLGALARRPDDHAASHLAGRSRRGRLCVAGAVLALFALGPGLLGRSVGDRPPGGTITGNAESGPTGLEALARAAEDRPDDAQAQLDYASALLRSDRPVDALRRFDVAARLDPTNPVPRAYSGWLIFLAGLTDEALPRLEAAISLDPAYPDAHFFRGIVLLRGRGDRRGALAELREYVRLLPTSPQRAEVQAVIDELAQSAPTTSP